MSTPGMDTARVVDGVVEMVARWPTVIEGEGVVEFAHGTAFAGMLWDGETLSNPPPDEPEPDPEPGVPAQVANWRVRVQLASMIAPDDSTALDAVNAALQAAIDGAPDAEARAAALANQQRWEYAPNVVTAEPLVQSMAPLAAAFGTTIEAVMTAAAAIPA